MRVIPAYYGPDINLVQSLAREEEISIGAALPYLKGSSLNRMRILSASGPLLLSIPVKKHPDGTLLNEICIDHMQRWQNQHWRSITSGYGKSPYFQYYKDELALLFSAKTERLADFTAPLLLWLLKQYFPGKKISLSLSSEPADFLPAAGYQPAEEMDKPAEEKRQAYRQVFGPDFVSGLSAPDHLFCAGPKFIWRLPE